MNKVPDGQKYDSYTKTCMFYNHSHPVYLVIFVISVVFSVGFLLPFFYLKIFLHLKQSKTKTHTSYNFCQRTALSSTINLSKGLFLSVLLFCISLLSYLLFVVFKNYENIVLDILYKYFYLFARSNSIFNPVIYATTNSLFRKAYERIFPLCFPKIKPENGIEEKNFKKKTKGEELVEPLNEQELEKLN